MRTTRRQAHDILLGAALVLLLPQNLWAQGSNEPDWNDGTPRQILEPKPIAPVPEPEPTPEVTAAPTATESPTDNQSAARPSTSASNQEGANADTTTATATPTPQPKPKPKPTPTPTPTPQPSQSRMDIRGDQKGDLIERSDEAAEDAPKADVGPQAQDDTPKRKFIKGDLVYPGTRRILSRFDHIGVSGGFNTIDTDFYLAAAPGMAWYFDSGLAMSLHLPLRFLAVEGGSLSYGGMKLRTQDWDEIPDFAKIVRFLTYGRKEANLYVTINTMRPATVGHGMIMNRYQGDIDVDRSLTSLIFDAYNDYAGFQLQANDITFRNQIVGGLAFVKPLSLFTSNKQARSLSIGLEYLADFKAPKCVRMSAKSNDCVQGTGHQAGFDPYTGDSLDQSFVRSDPETGRFVVHETMVHALGLSGEFKLYKDERNVDLKLYGTYHRFMNEGGGDGMAVGLLARLNAGTDYVSAFRLRGEYRSYTDGFLPNYFDSLYEIQKYAYLGRLRDYQVTPTKYQQVFGDPDNGFVRPEHGRRHGYNLDLTWALFGGSRSAKKIGLGVGLRDSTGPDDTNVYAHLEFPALGFLQIFGTYMRNNLSGLGALSEDPIEGQDAVLLTGLRFQILPVLFINAHYSRSYRVVRSPGSEYHLGNDNIVDNAGNPSTIFTHDALHENVQTLFVEVELGVEFE